MHYREEERISVDVIEDLLVKGIKNAKNTILSRCYAGEWTSILQCDSFRTSLPAAAEVKCVSGAGYFINAKAVSGAQHIEQFCSQVVQYMPQQRICLRLASRLSPVLWCCSQNEVVYISTPIFMNAHKQQVPIFFSKHHWFTCNEAMSMTALRNPIA